MKRKQPILPKKSTFCGGKLGSGTAKIKFSEDKYKEKVFDALKEFFKKKIPTFRGPEYYLYDNVYVKNKEGRKYLIKKQVLVNEKI